MSSEKRVTVRTSVPQHQKRVWVEHAEELDMSQSEFLATMVQAGRKVFEGNRPEPRPTDVVPRGNGLRSYVLETLQSDDHLSFDELLEATADDLDALLQSLTQAGTVRFSGKNGGFTVAERTDGDD